MSKGKVLIDGDIIAYRAAFATQDLTERDAEEKVDDLIEYILDQTIDLPFPSPEDYETYLTGKTNFRHDIAKSHPYKGNRSAAEKPEVFRCRHESIWLITGMLSLVSTKRLMI